MPNLDQFGKDYLAVALAIEHHIEGYVDAYYGPDEIKAQVDANGKIEPARLLEQVHALQATIPTADPARHAYMTAILKALEGTVRMLNGDDLPYLEEVQTLYDISPSLVDESQFEQAQKQLDTVLEGTGSLADRLATWRQQFQLSTEQILPLLEIARAETKRRTAVFIDLPPHETVEIQLASNQPWGAYNWYLGNSKSLIEFNTDVPLSALGLLNTFAHEGYPGHHTEALLKEQHLYYNKGYAEQSVMLLHSPTAVIAEGIATTAQEIIFPDNTATEWLVEILFKEASIDYHNVAEIEAIQQASAQLRYVGGNAAILYHTGQLTKEETLDYICTHRLASPERAQKSFDFLSHPLFRSYLFTYTQGYDLIAQASKKTERDSLFRRLLTEQMLPSQLG